LSEDLTAFAVAFASVWIGLGAYLVYLHRLSERLAAEIARAEAEADRARNDRPVRGR
jgi:hypothetical protein